MDLPLNEDFRDMLEALARFDVDYLVVGAYALAAHGIVRATEDIDIVVRPTRENAARVIDAIRAFGAPVEAHGVTAADFESPETVYQIGLPPRRIDLLTSLSGVSFDEACEGAVVGDLGSVRPRFIGRLALIRNKRSAGRGKDLVDVELLEKAGP